MIQKIYSYSLPISGGTVGAILQIISWHNILNVAIYAAVGGIIGYLVKLGMDSIIKKIKNYI